jgi:hypothetical protein
MVNHGNGVALIFARTETDLFHELIWRQASAVLFLRGRLFFHRPDGSRAGANAGAPSCLIAYGPTNASVLEQSGVDGHLVSLRPTQSQDPSQRHEAPRQSTADLKARSGRHQGHMAFIEVKIEGAEKVAAGD